MERRLLKVQDLANYIGTTPGSVYQMVSRRQIPFVKLGKSTRFDVVEIDTWIKRNSVKPLEGGIISTLKDGNG